MSSAFNGEFSHRGALQKRKNDNLGIGLWLLNILTADIDVSDRTLHKTERFNNQYILY